jgi:type I restriction enzyme S subunit
MTEFDPIALAKLIQDPEAVTLLESFLYDVAVESAAPSSTMVPISSLGTTFTGTSASESTRKVLEKIESSIPYISTKDVGYEADSINYDSGLNIPEGSSDFKIAPAGSVLICLEGGSAGKKMAITDRPIAFGNKLLALVPRQGVSPEYVFSLYKSTSFRVQFQNSMHGVIGGISQREFLKIQVHDLTPDQQSQMLGELADLLAKAKAITNLLVTKTKLARELSRTYKNRIQNGEMTVKLTELINVLKFVSFDNEALKDFQRAVTSLAFSGVLTSSDMSKWETKTLKDVGDWGAGSTPIKGNPAYYGGENPWFRSGELMDKLDLTGSEIKITDLAVKESSVKLNKKGNILLAIYGATVGRVAILGEDAYTNQAVLGCTPNGLVDSKFLYWYLIHLRPQFSEQSVGGAQPNLSKVRVEQFEIPVPPMESQKEVSEAIDGLWFEIDRLSEFQNKANKLRIDLLQALLKSWFF